MLTMKKMFLVAFFSAVFIVICSFSVSAATGMTVSYDSSTDHPSLCTSSAYDVSSIKIYDDVLLDAGKTSLSSCTNHQWDSASELWITNSNSLWCFTLEILNTKTGSSLATIRLLSGETWHKSLSSLGCNDFIIRLEESIPPYVPAAYSGGNGKNVTITQRIKLPDDTYVDIASISAWTGRWLDLSWTDYQGYTSVTKSQRVWVSNTGTVLQTYISELSHVAVSLYFCSPDGTRLYTTRVKHSPGEQITIDLQEILDESNSFADYLVAPASFTTSGTTNETRTVYMVNVGVHYDSGYAKGKNEADQAWQSRITDIRSESYDEGYSVGYNKGLTQNTLLPEQIDAIKSDYNLVSGFFDGIWTGCRNAYDRLSTISVGGVSIGTVIFLCVVALILIIVAKVWMK